MYSNKINVRISYNYMSESQPVPLAEKKIVKKKRFDVEEYFERDERELKKAVEYAQETQPLRGRGGRHILLTGVCNTHSIGAAIGELAHAAGAKIAYTYQRESDLEHAGDFFTRTGVHHAELDITDNEKAKKVVDAIGTDVFDKRIDIVIHGIAGGVNKRGELKPSLMDMGDEVMLRIFDTSALSFPRLIRHTLPYLLPEEQENDQDPKLKVKPKDPKLIDKPDPNALTITYEGGEKHVDGYGVMAPAKAALNALTRTLDNDEKVGRAGVRVNAISPGPIPTRAASGLPGFDELMYLTERRLPSGRLPTRAQVAFVALGIISPNMEAIRGTISYPDGGHHVVGVRTIYHRQAIEQ